MKRILAVPAAAVAAGALALAATGNGPAAAAPRKAAHHARPAAATARTDKTAATARTATSVKTARTATTVKTATRAKPGKPGKPATVTQSAKAARTARPAKARPGDPPYTFDSEFNGGQYVTVVTCSSKATPPPVRLAGPGAPLTLSGTGPSAGASKLLTKPGGYKTVYTCTIVVKKRVTKKVHLRKVVISTGFGGEAGSVARHRPAG